MLEQSKGARLIDIYDNNANALLDVISLGPL